MKKTLTVSFIILVVAAVAGYLFFSNFHSCNRDNGDDIILTDTIVAEPILEYGLPIDSFDIREGVLKQGQQLAPLLRDLGATGSMLTNLVLLPKDTFDVRRLRAGNPYKAFLSQDSTNRLCYFVYELTPSEYVVFNFCDSLHVTMDSKPVEVVRKRASASINSSLWNAAADNGINRMVALDLSDIYAWTIDFFGLQKGDHFDVIYDEKYIDSVSIGIGAIHAARFTNSGKTIYAFRFEQDSVFNYWDENGENLKKAFLKAPLKFSRISSGFSYARKHPVLKTVRPHTGVDYAAPSGTPVMSIGQGTVIEKGYKGGGGNTVKIRHNSVYTTAYLHLSKYAKGLNVGSKVAQGEVIGYVGSTGLSTGPHLDFRVWKNGKAVNPLTIESPPAEPIKLELKPMYDSLKTVLINELDGVYTIVKEEGPDTIQPVE